MHTDTEEDDRELNESRKDKQQRIFLLISDLLILAPLRLASSTCTNTNQPYAYLSQFIWYEFLLGPSDLFVIVFLLLLLVLQLFLFLCVLLLLLQLGLLLRSPLLVPQLLQLFVRQVRYRSRNKLFVI